ncbi:MAG: DUF1653 domain-containing protein [candidate division SR1 bacterium]|nr:DUF1653 domain-containing protein [candidate division SR1 bacterium]
MQLGKYRHYKGSLCEVIGIAKHTETGEDIVIYNHLDEQRNPSLRARPLSVWQEKAMIDGKEVERFIYIEESKVL